MAKLHDEWSVPPHGELVEVAEGVLTVEGTVAMPLGAFPRRMTVVALQSGGSAIWSAMPLREAAMARIEALGPVRFLIVPNQAHRLDLRPWHRRYPEARIVAPPRARSAVEKAAPVDATDEDFGDSTVRLELAAGTKRDEFALTVSRDDGTTLILNDILSNIRHPKGLGAQIMTRLFRFGVTHARVSRTARSLLVGDPAKLAAQFRSWAAIADLRRLIVSHGEVIDRAPDEALRRAAAELAD